jgi:hypothetical protein
LSGKTMSRRSAGIPALAKCAAMREPIVPAPRTATRRIGGMRKSGVSPVFKCSEAEGAREAAGRERTSGFPLWLAASTDGYL